MIQALQSDIPRQNGESKLESNGGHSLRFRVSGYRRSSREKNQTEHDMRKPGVLSKGISEHIRDGKTKGRKDMDHEMEFVMIEQFIGLCVSKFRGRFWGFQNDL